MASHSHTRKHTDSTAAEEPKAAPEAAHSQAALDEAEARVREARDAALRATAELQNLKRRQREEMDRLQDTATKELVLALLPVVDDMERALEAAGSTRSFDALREGVELILTKLLSALNTVGVARMPGPGEVFDPERHEAVMQTQPTGEFPSGTIAQELRAGYTQHDHVIRPSLVAVAHD